MYQIEIRKASANGKEFLIDAEDQELVDMYRWTVTPEGYVKAYLEKSRQDPTYKGKRERKVVYLHRLVMNAAEGELVDHISQDKLDNRKTNLRVASKSINALNSDRAKGTSGYRGVVRNKQKGKDWQAKITINGKVKHLGRFDKPEEAHQAYLKAREEIINGSN